MVSNGTDKLILPRAQVVTGHLYAVDLARGLAALAVLFWHYQHFYYPAAGIAVTPDPRLLPLHDLFFPLYDQGFLAVNFFWLLSGFVFSMVYRPGEATTRSFVVHRIARLYPLHLVTLLALVVLQTASLAATGHFQIYPANDLPHFAANLAFMSDGTSFNGPIWSVSVELVAYAAFWLSLPVLYRWGLVGPLLITGAGLAFSTHGPTWSRVFAECLCYFFIGVVVQLCFVRWSGRPALFALAGGGGSRGGVRVALVPSQRHGPAPPRLGTSPRLRGRADTVGGSRQDGEVDRRQHLRRLSVAHPDHRAGADGARCGRPHPRSRRQRLVAAWLPGGRIRRGAAVVPVDRAAVAPLAEEAGRYSLASLSAPAR